MNPMIGPMVMTVDQQFVEALEKKLELENALCDSGFRFVYNLLQRPPFNTPSNSWPGGESCDRFERFALLFRDWFTFNTRQAIEQAKRGPQDIFKFKPSDEALVNAQAAFSLAEGKLDAMRRYVAQMESDHVDPAQITLIKEMVIPDLEAQVELTQRTLSMVQKQIENSQS